MYLLYLYKCVTLNKKFKVKPSRCSFIDNNRCILIDCNCFALSSVNWIAENGCDCDIIEND